MRAITSLEVICRRLLRTNPSQSGGLLHGELDFSVSAILAPAQGRNEDGCGACFLGFVDESDEVGGELCRADVLVGFLIVVAKLDGHVGCVVL